MSIFVDINSTDYIVVEPMTRIGSYFGTAFELANEFKLTSNCGTDGSFCWEYSGAVFGGSSRYPNGGVFYNTIYLESAVSDLGLTTLTTSNITERNQCFMSKTCGRGIGVYKYSDIYPYGNLTVNYYDGSTMVGTDVFNYNVDYSRYGLTNYSTFGLSKTGHTGTGYWNTSDGRYSVHEDTGFKSGQKVAEAFGKDLTKGNQTVNVYAQWTPNQVKIAYHPNGGIIDGQLNEYGWIKYNNETYFHKINYGSKDDPYNANNTKTFNLRRTGYTFKGWKVKSTEEILDQNIEYDSTVYAQHNDKTKNTANTQTVYCYLYAQWEIKKYENRISHWAWGFNKEEGNNGNKKAFHLKNDYFSSTYNSTFTLDRDRATDIPNGFYLQNKFGTSSITGSWDNFNMGTKITQEAEEMRFEYDYWPTNYKITYELNGGTNNTNNPSTYNVLYGVTFENPTKTGYIFDGWYIGNTKVTGINQGANATFSSPEDMYSKLRSRTTGDKTITARWVPRGTLKITKVNSSNKKITGANIKFDVFSDSSCSNKVGNIDSTTNSNGEVSKKFNKGRYWVKEVSISKTGAKYIPDTDSCIYIGEISNEGDVIAKSITNKTTCEVGLQNLGSNPTMEQLIALYNEELSEYKNDYTNLLKTNNPSCSKAVCSKTSSIGCLKGSVGYSNFSENNLSCHDEVIRVKDIVSGSTNNNAVGFCSTSLNLTNNLGVSGEYTFYAKAGQLLIRQETLSSKIQIYDRVSKEYKELNTTNIAVGENEKICYLLPGYDYGKDITKDNINEYVKFRYKVFLGNNDSNETADGLSFEEKFIQIYNGDATTNSLKKYSISYFQGYNLNQIYFEKLTGKYSSSKTSKTTKSPIYGVLSNFNKTTGKIPYGISWQEKDDTGKWKEYKWEGSDSCKFSLEPEIIKYTPQDNGKVDLEFRTVDTTNPFNRTPKSNWSNQTDIDDKIKNSNNSYNVKNEESKYYTDTTTKTIILTPDKIKEIREWNKEKEYDNYLYNQNKNGTYTNAFFKKFGIKSN